MGFSGGPGYLQLGFDSSCLGGLVVEPLVFRYGATWLLSGILFSCSIIKPNSIYFFPGITLQVSGTSKSPRLPSHIRAAEASESLYGGCGYEPTGLSPRGEPSGPRMQSSLQAALVWGGAHVALATVSSDSLASILFSYIGCCTAYHHTLCLTILQWMLSRPSVDVSVSFPCLELLRGLSLGMYLNL